MNIHLFKELQSALAVSGSTLFDLEHDYDTALRSSLHALRNGKVILHPSDTLYGLAADATNASAVSLLREVKKRDRRPFLVFMSGVDMVQQYTICSPDVLDVLIAFQGKPVSLLLYANDRSLNSVCDIDMSIGVRIPKTGFSLDLVHMFKKPIATSSANISQHDYVGDIRSLLKMFVLERRVETCVVEKTEMTGLPSTVLDCRQKPFTVLRHGLVSEEMLSQYL